MGRRWRPGGGVGRDTMVKQEPRRRDALPYRQVTVDIVIPVYNEEHS